MIRRLLSSQLTAEIAVFIMVCAVLLFAFPWKRGAAKVPPPRPMTCAFVRLEGFLDGEDVYNPGEFAFVSPSGFGVLPDVGTEQVESKLGGVLHYVPSLPPVPRRWHPVFQGIPLPPVDAVGN